MWQSLSGLCPLPWWHQLVSSAIDDIITQLGKEKEDEEGRNHEEGQEGRSASTSHEGDKSHEVMCLTQEVIKGVALEADEGR